MGDHLDNHRAFGHDLAAVEAQRRDLAVGLQAILTICELRGADIDLGELIGVGRLPEARWGNSEQAPGEQTSFMEFPLLKLGSAERAITCICLE